MEIISRDDAQMSGRSKYYTGKPCKRGHVCARYVTNAACEQCVNRKVDKMDKVMNAPNPYSKELIPVPAIPGLSMPTIYNTPDERLALFVYLQGCIFHYAQQRGHLTPEIQAYADMTTQRIKTLDKMRRTS